MKREEKNRMKNGLLIVIMVINSWVLFSQEPITLLESTFKLGSKDVAEYYFGFQEGDQLIFGFEEVKGKDIKEISISEFPERVLFSDFKTSNIDKKSLKVQSTGIYKFQLQNGVGRRICKILIQRISKSGESQPFNSNVYWQAHNDTLYSEKNEMYLERCDTSYVNVLEQITKVHSNTNFNGNTSTLNFTLPVNTKVWSYYIGVDQSGQEAYQKATLQLAKSAGPLVAKIPGYGPAAALALGLTSYLSVAQKGEDIDYVLYTDGIRIKKGKVINGFARMENVSKGNYVFSFTNDNLIDGVSVWVKVTAVVVIQEWGTRKVLHSRIVSKNQPYLKNE